MPGSEMVPGLELIVLIEVGSGMHRRYYPYYDRIGAIPERKEARSNGKVCLQRDFLHAGAHCGHHGHHPYADHTRFDGQTGVTPKHTPSAPYPVLYLLHGGGNNHATWTGYANVEFYAEERNIAVVMPSGENKFYVDWPSDKFFKFISEELPDFVTSLFPVSKRPEDIYIAGLSMGGFGTVVHALNFPERFCAFGPISASFQLLNPAALVGTLDPNNFSASFIRDPDPRFDPSALAEKLAAEGKKFPKCYLACGKKDFLYEANVKFRDRLIELGCDVTWDAQ